MSRLLQIGTMLFLLVMLCAPICEFFDSWDPPGLTDDTEFAVFAIAFALCLVLAVCMLLKGRSLLVKLLPQFKLPNPLHRIAVPATPAVLSLFIPPPLLPLRI